MKLPVIRCVLLFIFVLFFSAKELYAQEKKLYNPAADADAEIRAAIRQAAGSGRHVLIQAGGNWCGWCIEFARFCNEDAAIRDSLNRHYVWYHLNYSKENTNAPIFARYGYAQRFGFPVFIILDGSGNRLHTQNSEYLEDGNKSYDREKVLSFLGHWTPRALDPSNYKDR